MDQIYQELLSDTHLAGCVSRISNRIQLLLVATFNGNYPIHNIQDELLFIQILRWSLVVAGKIFIFFRHLLFFFSCKAHPLFCLRQNLSKMFLHLFFCLLLSSSFSLSHAKSQGGGGDSSASDLSGKQQTETSTSLLQFNMPTKIGLKPLKENYNPLTRPKGKDKAATNVRVGIKLLALTEVSDIKQQLRIDILSQLSWIDTRLKDVVSKEDEPQHVDPMQIWSPGLAVANIDAPTIILSEGVTLWNDGTINLVRHSIETAAVDVDVHLFPFDQQSMEIQFEAMDYDHSEVVFVVDQALSTTSVEFEEIWELASWKITSEKRTSIVNGKPDSYIIAKVRVRRLFSMAFLTLVFPLFLITNFTFAAFFVFIGDFGTRVGIASTGFLTLIAFTYVISENIPKISYWTWLHRYQFTSSLFVMFVMLELIVVHGMDHAGLAAKKVMGKLIDEEKQKGSSRYRKAMLAYSIDWYSTWLVPLCYALMTSIELYCVYRERHSINMQFDVAENAAASLAPASLPAQITARLGASAGAMLMGQ